MFSSTDTVLHKRVAGVEYVSSSNFSQQRSNFSHKLTPSDIFSDTKRYIDMTSEHRNNFKVSICSKFRIFSF